MTTKDWKLLAEQLDRELGLKHTPYRYHIF